MPPHESLHKRGQRPDILAREVLGHDLKIGHKRGGFAGPLQLSWRGAKERLGATWNASCEPPPSMITRSSWAIEHTGACNRP